MGNNKLFRALSSSTRLEILKKLLVNEMHLTGLAKEIGISVPVTSRHVKILEDAGLIKKRVVGNVYLLKATVGNFEKMLEPFTEEFSIEIEEEKSLFDALKQIPGVEVEERKGHQYIKSIDGDEGYYIYEINGRLPKKPIDEYMVNKNVTLDLKKLISVKRKNIRIKVKK